MAFDDDEHKVESNSMANLLPSNNRNPHRVSLSPRAPTGNQHSALFLCPWKLKNEEHVLGAVREGSSHAGCGGTWL